jgi:hypothetical protein
MTMTDHPEHAPPSTVHGEVKRLTEAGLLSRRHIGRSTMIRANIFGSWAARYLQTPGPPPHDLDVLVVGRPARGSVYDKPGTSGTRQECRDADQMTADPSVLGRFFAESESRGDDINAAAVTAYRTSISTGRPFSERKLVAMFGKTSRRWARNRMADAP